MTNLEKIRAMSAEELAGYLNCKCCDNYENGVPCKGATCNDNVKIFWLNQETNLMPELKAGDLLFTGKIVEFYVAIAPDKLVKANCFVVMDLDNVLKHDKIAYVARWNGVLNDIERIWRADNE